MVSPYFGSTSAFLSIVVHVSLKVQKSYIFGNHNYITRLLLLFGGGWVAIRKRNLLISSKQFTKIRRSKGTTASLLGINILIRLAHALQTIIYATQDPWIRYSWQDANHKQQEIRLTRTNKTKPILTKNSS